jgi:hypothetical protein
VGYVGVSMFFESPKGFLFVILVEQIKNNRLTDSEKGIVTTVSGKPKTLGSSP